jgi:DNA-binding MarR family transcriptional regulator
VARFAPSAVAAPFSGRTILSARVKARAPSDAALALDSAEAKQRSQAVPPESDEVFEMMELFFFAYRDFVKDADRLLENYKFGRAHHRVLHFVNRRPGLAIAALLDILKITKQSLNRVLKPLLDGGFVEAREGANDRRQRLLYPSAKGAALAHDLARLQSARFLRVLDGLDAKARRSATEFLLAMIDEEDRAGVRAHLEHAGNGSGKAARRIENKRRLEFEP